MSMTGRDRMGIFEPQRGAEALVDLVTWNGMKAIRKIRVPKIYRNPDLDQNLRTKRTKQEIVILHSAKLVGIHCPKVFFGDPKTCEIIMEFVDGIHVKDISQDVVLTKISNEIYFKIGSSIALLHHFKIAHGDLTTKNILVRDAEIYLIDFGLSFFSERLEDRADDLHLLKQALRSSHSESESSRSFSNILSGYEAVEGTKETRSVALQILEIEKRGRYARVD
jgi:TP53 regulating kinase-like protein